MSNQSKKPARFSHITKPIKARRHRALELIRSYYENVTEVTDATSDFPFEVTVDNIRKGRARNHTQCPAAKGLDDCPKVTGSIVAKRSAYVIFGEKAIRYRVPEALTREEIAVDRGGSFEPGQYTLKAPRKGERLTDRYTGKTHNKSNRAKPGFKQRAHMTEAVRTTLGLRAHIS